METSSLRLRYKASACQLPLMGSRVAPQLVTLCVALSLALFSLGGPDPGGWFFLRILRFGRPMAIVGPILDTVVISHAIVVGTMCVESGRPVNMGLLHLVRARCFASSVVTPQGNKSQKLPLRTPTSSHTISRCLLASLIVPEKRERENERVGFRGLEGIASPSLSNHGQKRLTPSKVMQMHLQSFMSQGFMTVSELATCRVPEDPTSPVPAE
jgi:hypothetical protein